MAYSETTLKSSDDKSYPYFKPFWIGKLSDKCLTIKALLYVSFKHILISQTNVMGIPNCIRILYKASLLTESLAFLKSMNS
jgi:hypothetical protein